MVECMTECETRSQYCNVSTVYDSMDDSDSVLYGVWLTQTRYCTVYGWMVDSDSVLYNVWLDVELRLAIVQCMVGWVTQTRYCTVYGWMGDSDSVVYSAWLDG